MLKQYKNSLLKILEQQQLDPHLFQAEESGNGATFTIQLKDSPLKFEVMNNLQNFHIFSWRHIEVGWQ